LGDNAIGDEGAKRFAEALRVNKTLSTLMMAENVDIGVIGSTHLCDTMLQYNHTLTSLDITVRSPGLFVMHLIDVLFHSISL
jgi:hypothetical protein